MPNPKKVFIIHGRNMEARAQLGVFVRSLGLVPALGDQVVEVEQLAIEMDAFNDERLADW